MAVQTATFLKGKINNVIFYQIGNTHAARSAPAAVRQTEATKVRSRNFGLASSAGRTLRSLLLPVLPFPKDKKMQSRFSGAIAQWLAQNNAADLQPQPSIPFVTGFSFNDATSFAERCKLSLTVTQRSSNEIEILLPAFVPTAVVSAPAHTVMVEFIITVASCGLTNAVAGGTVTHRIEIPYNNTEQSAQSLLFPVSTAPGSLLITAAALRYTLANGEVENRSAFLPASVVEGRYC